jgi:hypothetical protein
MVLLRTRISRALLGIRNFEEHPDCKQLVGLVSHQDRYSCENISQEGSKGMESRNRGYARTLQMRLPGASDRSLRDDHPCLRFDIGTVNGKVTVAESTKVHVPL